MRHRVGERTEPEGACVIVRRLVAVSPYGPLRTTHYSDSLEYFLGSPKNEDSSGLKIVDKSPGEPPPFGDPFEAHHSNSSHPPQNLRLADGNTKFKHQYNHHGKVVEQ
jgi:hypothetical protein